MPVRIGINPLTWTNDDMPWLGAETPLETCLGEAKQAGYDGVELGNKFPRQPEALRQVLAAHGLALASGWYSSSLLTRSVEAEIAAVEDHLVLLQAQGCKVMVFCETAGAVHGEQKTPVSRRPVLDDAQWQRLLGGVEAVGRHLAGRGMRLAYHHHMGTVIQTQGEIDRLMAGTSDAVGLLLDTGHLTFAGGDPVAAAKQHVGRIVHVHCKDIRRPVLERVLAADSSFLDAVLEGVFTVPGDGSIDYPAVLKPVAASGYDGWLVVEAEQDPAKAHPLTYARMGYDYLAKTARAAGF